MSDTFKAAITIAIVTTTAINKAVIILSTTMVAVKINIIILFNIYKKAYLFLYPEMCS